MAEGHYTMIRLVVSSAVLYFYATTILVDFDGERSVVERATAVTG
jgi:hypothetical protein